MKEEYPAVVRFTAGGSPDATFGTNGEVLLNQPSDPWAFGAGVQSTGQIVVCGNFSLATGGVGRLNTNGTLDTTFGSGGYFILPTGVGTALALTVQPDDKILIDGGTPSPSGSNGFAVDRVLADGSSLDPTFGAGGQATATFSSSQDAAAWASALRPDAKITVAGSVRISPSQFDYGIARFTNDISSNTPLTTATISLTKAVTALAPPTASTSASANGPSSLALAPLVLDSPDLWDNLGLKRRSRLA